MSILKVENFSSGYGKKQVLYNISFEVDKGEIVLVAGSNGSGKSTLLKAIYGQLPQWGDGQVLFDGENITGKPTAALLDKGLLYIPQKNNLFEELTVKENLEIAGLTIEKRLLKKRIEEAFSVFNSLAPSVKRTPMTLSGGERQLLTMAMATLHQPKMILVDEPFAGLSPKNIEFVIDNFIKLNKLFDVTLAIVEHRVKECLKIVDKIICVKYGKVYNSIVINEDFNINELKSVFL